MTMASLAFLFPSTLNTAGAVGLRKKLDLLPSSDEYVLDFSQLGHTEPFGMLLAAATINEFAEERHAVVSGINFERCGYQSHMGFFRAIGVEQATASGDAAGGVNYLPLTSLNVAGLQQEAASTHRLERWSRTMQR
jgi:hypothetical protein